MQRRQTWFFDTFRSFSAAAAKASASIRTEADMLKFILRHVLGINAGMMIDPNGGG